MFSKSAFSKSAFSKSAMTSKTVRPPAAAIPRWLRVVLRCDRAGSSWYIGLGFFFAPALIVVSPWPALTAALWVGIALAGLWLGVLGVAMATGLAIVLRAGQEIPEDYWRSILDYPGVTTGAPGAQPGSPARCSRPASV